MDKEDISLVKAAKDDATRYDALYRKYSSRLYNYFWYRVGHDGAMAEDLMQETFLRAFRDLRKFEMRAYSYYSYLLAIAHNVLVNHYRKPKSIPLESVGDVPVEIVGDIERKRDSELLWRAIQQLPMSEKDALYLKYRSDMPVKDIARIMGRSENAVKLLLSRARKRLSRHAVASASGFADRKRSHTRPRYAEGRAAAP